MVYVIAAGGLVIRAIATLIVLVAAVSSLAAPPSILIGVDAQPTTNFARVKAIGNALHRYDAGPQKNVTLRQWVDAAHAAGLYSIVQGSKADEQGVALASLPSTVVAISQDDEPDINRRPSGPVSPDVIAEAERWQYGPSNAPHPSTVGWTLPQILATRYARWKTATPLPVVVNFAGNSINSVWYKPDLIYHRGYIGASDQQGADTYPRNNQGDGGHLYWPVNVLDKIRAAGGKPIDAYVECSWQGRAGGIAPKPAEQSTLIWSAIGHGARRIWYFTQRTDPPAQFDYWAMPAENEAQAKADAAVIFARADLIVGGELTTTQTPKVQADGYKGAIVWPDSESFKWTRGTESLTVTLDYVGGRAPVVVYAGAPTPPPDPIAAKIDALSARVDVLSDRISSLAAVVAARPVVTISPATQPTARP